MFAFWEKKSLPFGLFSEVSPSGSNWKETKSSCFFEPPATGCELPIKAKIEEFYLPLLEKCEFEYREQTWFGRFLDFWCKKNLVLRNELGIDVCLHIQNSRLKIWWENPAGCFGRKWPWISRMKISNFDGLVGLQVFKTTRCPNKFLENYFSINFEPRKTQKTDAGRKNNPNIQIEVPLL